MYSNGYVVSVFIGSQVLNELKGNQVRVPFGTEYRIRLRNKNNRRAVAYVSIDGENVSGNGLIIEAGQHVDLEQSVEMTGKFKFVSSSSTLAAAAGKAGDPNKKNGVVRVRWQLEKEPEAIMHSLIPLQRHPWMKPTIWPKGPIRREMTAENPVPLTTTDSGDCFRSSMTRSLMSCSLNACAAAPLPAEDGCTVTGSHSDQNFRVGYIGDLEEHETVIELLLIGYESEISREEWMAGPSAHPSKFCGQCGHKHASASAKFCTECGTKV